MTAPRVVGGMLAVVAVSAGVVAVGRWQAHRADDAQLRGIAHIRAGVGPLDGPRLDAYRVTPMFDCLLFRAGPDPVARELCFDSSGDLVEAIARTALHSSVFSVRYQPSLADIHVPPALLLSLLGRLGARAYVAGYTDTLPVGHEDVGPIPRGHAPPG